MRQHSSARLERVRRYSLTVALLLLAVLLVLTFVGSRNGTGQPWETVFMVIAVLMVAAGIVFAVASWTVAYRREFARAAQGDSLHAPPNRIVPVIVLALLAVVANASAVLMSGRPNLLGWALGALVVAALWLFQETALRRGNKSREK